MVSRLDLKTGDRLQVSPIVGGDIMVTIDEVDLQTIFAVYLTKSESAALRRLLFNAEWDVP